MLTNVLLPFIDVLGDEFHGEGDSFKHLFSIRSERILICNGYNSISNLFGSNRPYGSKFVEVPWLNWDWLKCSQVRLE